MGYVEGAREKDAAEALVGAVNTFCFRDEVFAEVVGTAHKTLQQSVMRVMLATIRRLAVNSTDERNEATVELAKKIVEVADGAALPFI